MSQKIRLVPFAEGARAEVTLDSIGDAVVSADIRGRVTYLNAVAERMTGWLREEAAGRPLEEVLRIIDATTQEAVPNPMRSAIRDDRTMGLTPNCVLIRRDGFEVAIEDSAAPIHDRRGQATGAVMVFRDVSAARALSLRLSHLAHHDSLTDLPNRILLDDRLKQAMARAHRHEQKVALLFLDVDRFKNINDSLGHCLGDRLLQSIAQRLLACVRSSDTVSRPGGDEFVIMLTEVTCPRDVAVSAEKLLLAFGTPHRIDQHDLRLTASIGIAIYPDDAIDAETLVKNADAAMYCAKDRGRDNYQFFQGDMIGRVAERRSLERDLRVALERQELVLYYQPRVRLDTGAIIGAEALIRWRHPERGLLLPAQFIPIAEEGGVIVPIGRWVLREACHQARAWRDAGLPPMTIAVNISEVELRAGDFAAGVRAVLADTGLEPQHLELELTESLLMQDSTSTAAVLRSLKDMGVQLALDDFGTGHASLGLLKHFPFDTLKIDQSFVCDLCRNAQDASIVNAVIGIGKSLHLRIVAEGVATREQHAFLKMQGCPEGQGYYFSKPLAALEFAEFLRGGSACRHRPTAERPATANG